MLALRPAAVIYPVVLLVFGVSVVIAQTNPEGATLKKSELALRRAWEITPSLSLTQTFTDNLLLSDTNKTSDLLLVLTPAIQIRADSSHLKGVVNYSRRENFYTQNDGRKSSQNSLNANGTFEAIEDRFFIDASGIISQQTISALGTQSVSTATTNSNQTETLNLQISPYLKGAISDYAAYEARYRSSTTETKANLASDFQNEDWSFSLKSKAPIYGLDWSMAGKLTKSSYSSGQERQSDSFKTDFAYRLSKQLLLRAAIGSESNNYLSSDKRAYTISTLGLDWSLSERTKISLTKGNEYYGSSHSFTFEHRTPLSAWRFTDARSAATLPDQLSGSTQGTNYDLLYALFASQEPDPVKREKLVNDYLKANGIAPNQLVNSGFLSSSISLQRRQELSMTLIGARNTVTATAQRIQSERLGNTSGAGDAFANSSNIEQNGMGLNWAYRLSPNSVINMGLLRNKSTSAQNVQRSTLNSLTLGMTTRIGAHTNANLSARRTQFESNLNSYNENTLTGTVSMQYQ